MHLSVTVHLGSHYKTKSIKIMKKSTTILVLILCFAISNSLIFSQIIKREVIGNGGTTIGDGKNKIVGTIGQTAIGRISDKSTSHGVGFWYESKKIIDINSSGLTVVIPRLTAEIGSKISVPLFIEYSKNLNDTNDITYEAKISYNGTVLYPNNLTPSCILDSDECSVIVKGKLNDTIGILANIDFTVKLGNADSTLLKIEYFSLSKPGNLMLITRDGQLDILGICRAGDTPRLIKHGQPTALLSCYPNPASSSTSINYTLNEVGKTEMFLIDEQGKIALNLFNSTSVPGNYILNAKLTDLRSGSYFLVMKTPSEFFTKLLIVNK